MLSTQAASYIRCKTSVSHTVTFSAVNYGGMLQFLKLNVFNLLFSCPRLACDLILQTA